MLAGRGHSCNRACKAYVQQIAGEREIAQKKKAGEREYCARHVCVAVHDVHLRSLRERETHAGAKQDSRLARLKTGGWSCIQVTSRQ